MLSRMARGPSKKDLAARGNALSSWVLARMMCSSFREEVYQAVGTCPTLPTCHQTVDALDLVAPGWTRRAGEHAS
jgi:hypothetical protein